MLKNQSESMIDTYKREIKACESIIVVQKKEKFISCIKKLKEEKRQLIKKRVIKIIWKKIWQAQKEDEWHIDISWRNKIIRRSFQTEQRYWYCQNFARFFAINIVVFCRNENTCDDQFECEQKIFDPKNSAFV